MCIHPSVQVLDLLDLEFRNYGSDSVGIPLTYRLNLDHSVYETKSESH